MKVSFSAPGLLAWLGIFLRLASLAQGFQISLSDADNSPRAALVSITHEDDLPAVLFTIHQLEETFNEQYQYHWVFFSKEPLSETFRRQTSNATKAICLYEVMSPEHWRIDPGFKNSAHVSAATA